MSRPGDSGSVTDGDVGRAIAELHRQHQYVTRESVATELCLTTEGLRKRHRRRGLTWLEYREICTRSVPPQAVGRSRESAA